MKNKYYNSLPQFGEAIKRGYFPDYVKVWSNSRVQALEAMYNHAVFGTDLEAGKIIVEGAKPGQGKSTLLQAVATEAERKLMTALVMTDSNSRLGADIQPAIKSQGQWLDYSTDVAYLSRNDKKVTAGDIKSMSLANLVAMSCQRYLLVNDEIRKNAQTHWWRGQTDYREVFCIDEAFEDVTAREWNYSDLTRFFGVLRETIRPEKEWAENIGETAQKAEKYARILVDDLLMEVDRINRIKLPESKKGLPSEGQMHIDFYTGREERREEANKKWRESWPTLLELVQSVKDGIKETKRDLRSIEENQIFAECNKILKTMSGKIENSRNETIIVTIKKIEGLAERLAPGRFRSELKDMATEARRNAEKAFAAEELSKIVKNNRENMLQNNEHVRGQAMTSDEFLDVFDSDNIVFLQASNYGDDKQDRCSQIKIWTCKYNIKSLPYERMKTIIYDGTAAINPMYDNADIFQKIEYHKPKTHVKFVQLDEKCTKTYLAQEQNRNRLYQLVNNILWERYGLSNGREYTGINLDPSSLMISSFLGCATEAVRNGLAWPEGYQPVGTEMCPLSSHPLATYGSALVTGSNEYKDCSILCKIGALILPPTTIFQRICCRNKQFYEEFLQKDEVYRAKQLQLIYTYNSDESDYKDIIEDCTIRTAMADIVQEINRLRIRGWCESADQEEQTKYDITVIWALRGRKQGEYELRDEQFFEKLFRKIMEEFGSGPQNPDDYEYYASRLSPRLKSTDKVGTVMQRAMEWYQQWPEGKEFTISDMAEALKITKKSLNALLAKQQNKEFLDLIRGANDENMKKAKGRAGYVYTKPVTDRKTAETEKYEQQSLDLANM